MTERGWGRAVTSVNAVQPYREEAVHNTTKAALLSPSQGVEAKGSLDEERPYRELDRRGPPEEVAAVIALLCSNRASFVNGANVRVEGGAVATMQV